MLDAHNLTNITLTLSSLPSLLPQLQGAFSVVYLNTTRHATPVYAVRLGSEENGQTLTPLHVPLTSTLLLMMMYCSDSSTVENVYSNKRR